MPLLRLIAMAFIASGSALAPAVALAAPLDKEQCANLQSERKKLLTPEMQSALERGPDWVKDHLDPTKIEQVRRFLSIEEMLVFRCRGGGVAKVVAVPEGPVPLPDRNPNRPLATTADAQPAPTVSADAASGPGAADTGRAAKPSQTVADSDKTPPAKAKATR